MCLLSHGLMHWIYPYEVLRPSVEGLGVHSCCAAVVQQPELGNMLHTCILPLVWLFRSLHI